MNKETKDIYDEVRKEFDEECKKYADCVDCPFRNADDDYQCKALFSIDYMINKLKEVKKYDN